MAEKINVAPDLQVSVEKSKVTTITRRGVKYAKVQKHVPIEWAGEDVIIIRKREFDEILKLVNGLVRIVTYLLSDEVKKREIIEEAKKIKLSKKDFGF